MERLISDPALLLHARKRALAITHGAAAQGSLWRKLRLGLQVVRWASQLQTKEAKPWQTRNAKSWSRCGLDDELDAAAWAFESSTFKTFVFGMTTA